MQQLTTQESESARQAIDATNRRFEAAIAAGGSTSPMGELYARDARILPPGAPLMQGRENIGRFWQGAVQQLGIQRAELQTLSLDIHGEAAHEVGYGTLSLAGGQQVVAKYVVVW